LGVAAGAIVLLVQLGYWQPNPAARDVSSLDVPAFYRAAAHVLAREPLYDEAIHHVAGQTATYIYPPPFAVLIAPLALLGPAKFQVAWYVGVLVAFWLYAAALVRLAGQPRTIERVLVAGACLQLFPGTSVTMSFGNADLLVWALCATALVDGKAGARWAGAAAAIKVYPAWILLTKAWKEALAGVAVGATLLAASAPVVGIEGFRDWMRVVGVLGSGVDWPTNVSFVHLIGYSGKGAPLFVLVGAPLTAWLLRRQPRSLAGAVVLIAAVFLAPVCWVHYAPMLLMPVAAAFAARARAAAALSP
jgi:hypothetical protein